MSKNRNKTGNRNRDTKAVAPNTKRSRNAAERHVVDEALTDFEAREEYRLSKPKFGKLEGRTEKQKSVIRDLEDEAKRMMYLVGPAGTGKTFLPTSYAAEQLLAGKIEGIIITRPMVGCDEDMGFLPGSEQEKFDSWVGPFIEILEGKLGKRKVQFYRDQGMIIAKPLMMMRGSTFRTSIVILDEAQNTTTSQMKMFLTRCGQGSRMIINGDLEQSDLPAHVPNGLAQALSLFKNSKIAAYHKFTDEDITRDPLVREIVRAYRQMYKQAAKKTQTFTQAVKQVGQAKWSVKSIASGARQVFARLSF